MDIQYRRAESTDLAAVIEFVDYWLAGRGGVGRVPGVVNDYFISHKQHFDYIRRYHVLLALDGGKIAGWAVRNNHKVLIALLVAGTHRGSGIGSEMLCRLNPELIRSKTDQSTGDPAGFYKHCGYVRPSTERIGKKQNIELYIRADC